MAEIDKDKIEKLCELVDICPGQEVRLTQEDIKAINYARAIIWKYQMIQDIMVDELKAFHPLDREPYRLARIKDIVNYPSPKGNGLASTQ